VLPFTNYTSVIPSFSFEGEMSANIYKPCRPWWIHTSFPFVWSFSNSFLRKISNKLLTKVFFEWQKIPFSSSCCIMIALVALDNVGIVNTQKDHFNEKTKVPPLLLLWFVNSCHLITEVNFPHAFIVGLDNLLPVNLFGDPLTPNFYSPTYHASCISLIICFSTRVIIFNQAGTTGGG